MKLVSKILVDIATTIIMLGLMAYLLVGEAMHEWLGVAIFILFIIHHLLNAGWHKTLLMGRYTPLRLFQNVLDVLLFLSMLGSMVSGIMMSQEVFSFLSITRGMAFARLLHMLASYWGFVFVSMHLGLHWGMVMGMMRKVFGIRKPSIVRTWVLRLVAVLIAAFGCYAFFKNDLDAYMLLQTQFVLFDMEQPLSLFFLEYAGIMGLWAIIGYYTGRLSVRLGKRKRTSEKI